MRGPRPWLALLVLLFIPQSAAADDHRAEFFAAAFSFVPGSLLLGPHIAVGMPIEGVLDDNLAVVGDFSVHFGSDEDEGKRATFAGGIRYSFAKPDFPTMVNSARVLMGGVYGSDAFDSGTDFAILVGYEFEYVPQRSKSVEGWGLRGQVDRVIRTDDKEDFWRFSAGFVYRWKKP